MRALAVYEPDSATTEVTTRAQADMAAMLPEALQALHVAAPALVAQLAPVPQQLVPRVPTPSPRPLSPRKRGQ